MGEPWAADVDDQHCPSPTIWTERSPSVFGIVMDNYISNLVECDAAIKSVSVSFLLASLGDPHSNSHLIPEI